MPGLSVAGARAGLTGDRSGLFMEQVRLTKELRQADRQRGRTGADIRPRWFIWENVPGVFSSGDPKGEDFRIVLEEVVRIVAENMRFTKPFDVGWLQAGAMEDMAEGNVFSLAWRCLDAQYWGVGQRRNRIFMVADFSGPLAPALLFDVLTDLKES